MVAGGYLAGVGLSGLQVKNLERQLPINLDNMGDMTHVCVSKVSFLSMSHVSKVSFLSTPP